tara:strand:+ start:221694 stop:223241 length:1548 start_codon:yes stop_codon:yes gene_type:complete
MNFFKAMATVAGLTFISRIAGFLRDILTAALLGAGPLADAFFVALKLPNFFRRISAEGAFTVAFVPIYTSIKQERGDKEAALFAAHIVMLMTAILGAFIALCMMLMPFVIMLIAPGFEVGSERYIAAIDYARITFPYLLLISITAMFGAMLNANGKFAPFAAAPILFNLTLIAAMVFAHHNGYEVAKALSMGITVSGFVQLGFMALMVFRNKIQPKFKSFSFDNDVKKVFSLMGPGVLGAGVMHINLFADLIIASFLPVGAISALYYADRLNQLPLGVVGIAMGTALLPMLSLAIAKANSARAKELFNQALEACVFFALPAALALFLLSDFIISVLFERGAFDGESTRRSAFALMGYCVGLTPYVASKVLSTVFWANKDTWTPVKISIRITVLNIILSLILIIPFQEAGIALSTGLVGWLQFFLLKRASRGYDEAQLTSGFYKRIIKLFASALIMGAIVFSAALALRPLFTDGLSEFILLGFIVFLGIAAYISSVFLLRIYRLSDIKNLFVKPQS